MTTPYLRFGKIVTELRKRFQETKTELCLTLEINEKLLTAIENGSVQPTEELVDQLISHFHLDESSAHNMWRLAGYGEMIQSDQSPTPVFVPLPDVKINYTDLVHVSVNNFGLVLNFMQGSGPGNQPMIVSRLGMSKEHALSVIEVMTDAIKRSNEQEQQSKITKKKFELPEPKRLDDQENKLA